MRKDQPGFRKHTDYVFQNTGRAGPALCALALSPRHRGSGCLDAAAPVTGAAADEYNLNVVDCNASVTVARWSSISVSGGLGVPPAAGGKREKKMGGVGPVRGLSGGGRGGWCEELVRSG
jgi:hypothetical protein